MRRVASVVLGLLYQVCEKRKKLLRDSRMNLLFLCPPFVTQLWVFTLLAWTWVLSLCSSCAYKALLGAGACQGFIIFRTLKRSDTSQCQLGESLFGWKVLLQQRDIL
jgi:hypothetical protein